MAGNRVSVVIPVHDGGSCFERCLNALAASDPAPLETIVVCDGSPDATLAYALTRGARVVSLATRRGPARARNAGAREARGGLLLFLDSDVMAPPDLVVRVERAFASDPGLAALIGSYDDAPAEMGFLSQYRNLLHHFVHQTSSTQAGTFWGACGGIRRDVFHAVGGFDESYTQPSIEDIELGSRLTRAGYRIRLDPALQVKHLKRWPAGALLKTDFLRRALPWTRLILREGRLVNDLNLRASARATTALLYCALALLVAAGWTADWLLPAAAALATALALNAPFYRFLAGKRGWGFALRAVPWHWLYFLSSGLAFAIGAGEHLYARFGRRAAALPAAREPTSPGLKADPES